MASTANYTIPKGIISIKTVGTNTWRDVGNAPQFEVAYEATKLEHNTSRAGIATVDFTATTAQKTTITTSLEEWDVDNIALAIDGLSTDLSGEQLIEAGQGTDVQVSVKIVQTQDIGPQYTWLFPTCTVNRAATLSLIGEEFASIPLVIDVLATTTDEAWVTTTAYSLGDRVVASGKIYECTTAGTSGTPAPSSKESAVTDGTVTWAYIGLDNSTFIAREIV